MIYVILIIICIVLLVVAIVENFSIKIATRFIAEFEKWANKYGYTFLDTNHVLESPDKVMSVIDEIEDIVKNGYDGAWQVRR